MNAYELAEIMEVHDGSQVWEHGLEIANMLRQQADRIAELEKWEERWSKRCQRQQNRIAELEKFTKAILKKGGYPYEQSEPVAWLIQAKTWHEFSFDKPADDYSENESIEIEPLYTTPQTKPLSDEEIMEIKTLIEINYGCVPPLEFAWAIEAKVRGQS